MARNETVTTIGLRHVRVAKRGTDNLIEIPADWPAGTAYNGLRIGGALAMTATLPPPNRVVARGDDRAYHTFNLPPTEGVTGELRVSKSAMDVMALLTDTLVFGNSPVRKVGMGTDRQGLEPAVLLWGCNMGVDTEDGSPYYGQQVWNTYIFLNALCTPSPASKEDQAIGEVTYAVSANDATVDELGVAFTRAINGFTKAPYLMITTLDQFMLDSFEGTGAVTEFTLSETPSEEITPQVAQDGAVLTEEEDYTISEGVLTITPAPADGSKILVEYTYA